MINIMINIEIHGGFRDPSAPAELEHQISDLFKDRPYFDKIEVGFCNDHAHDLHGKETPFLRLLSSDPSLTEEILERLQIMNMDIQCLNVRKFIPKKQ